MKKRDDFFLLPPSGPLVARATSPTSTLTMRPSPAPISSLITRIDLDDSFLNLTSFAKGQSPSFEEGKGGFTEEDESTISNPPSPTLSTASTITIPYTNGGISISSSTDAVDLEVMNINFVKGEGGGGRRRRWLTGGMTERRCGEERP